jgi:signal transduction histidine kinase
VSRRLVLSTLAVVLVVVVLLGAPLGVATTNSIKSNAEESVEQDAQKLLGAVEVRLELDQPVDSAGLKEYVSKGRYAKVILPVTGDSVTVGVQPDKEDKPIIAKRASTQGVYVTVQEPSQRIENAIRRAWLLIGVEVFFALATAAALAALQARGLGRPLVELAETAEQLGRGMTRRRRHRKYGVPELDRVADELDRSADRVARILAAERQFASHVSHQLRTPLTALSMRLEEITLSDDLDNVREEAEVALAQVERLVEVVQQLLTYQRSPDQPPAELVDVDTVVQQQFDEWRPAFNKAGRGIVLAGVPGLMAKATPGTLGQVMATLLENSLFHGAGTATVRTRTVGGSVVVEVTDEGPGVPDELGQRVFERRVSGRRSGSGLGLALARDLAEADGARLELVQQRPPVFALFLGTPEHLTDQLRYVEPVPR